MSSLPWLLHELQARSSDPDPSQYSWTDPLTAFSVENSPNTTQDTTIDHFSQKKLWLRVVVGSVSLLSMIGALLIVLSYVCIASIRTRSREILVHLSLADFGVACANLIGVVVDFDHYLTDCHHSWCPEVNNLCKAQGFFAGFFTIASVLWTLALSVYIYLLVVHATRNFHSKAVYFLYVFCWGLPLVISLWLVLTGRLGHTDHGGSGWCSLKIDNKKRSTAIFITLLGNDLWIYLTVVVVTILYITTHCHIKQHTYTWEIEMALQELKLHTESCDLLVKIKTVEELQGTLKSRPNNSVVMDVKFLLIPVAFLLLRIGSMVIIIVFVYVRATPSRNITYFLLCLAGIGDSGQGFVNAILFCAFTTKVRKKFKNGLARLSPGHCCRRRPHNYDLDCSTNTTTYSSTAETSNGVLLKYNS